MPMVEQPQTKFPLRAAMEARDHQAVVDAFAPDAILRSPFTSKLVFRGTEELAVITDVILEVFEDVRYTDEIRGDHTALLVSTATVGGQEIEIADHLLLAPDGKIKQMTVFFRPLPPTTAALRLIGSGLARRKSKRRAAVISALAGPLALMSKTGDALGVRLVRGAL